MKVLLERSLYCKTWTKQEVIWPAECFQASRLKLRVPVRYGIVKSFIPLAEDDGIWLVSFMDYDLGYIDLEEKTLQPLENPFGPRV